MARHATYKRPWLADYQLAALFHDKRYGVIEATTKAGKTVGCMVWLTEQAMQGRAGRNYWWIAPTLPVAKIVYRRLKRALPRAIYTAHETDVKLTLANDTVLWFKGADKPDTLYGEDVYAAVMDEASRHKEEAWHAVRSTLTATRGPIRIIGNVKGRKNWAYLLARRAESGDPAMAYAKITAYDAVQAGILDADEVEDAKRHLPEHVFRELYLAEPSDDGGNPFGIAAIAKCVADLSPEAPVVYGIDLAKSVDWTVVIGLDGSGRVCLCERWQAPWEATITRILGLVGSTPTLVDSTGVGDPVLERLQKAGEGQSAQVRGFKFTSTSKQQLMEGLAVAIQQQLIRVPEGPVRQELESFEYVATRTGVRYSAPEGLHDDCVCALALAVEQWRTLWPDVHVWGGAVPVVSPVLEGPHPEVDPAIAEALAASGVYWPGGN